ncbi:MAG: hypothetical protein ACRDRK_18940 [Pseudonocardia sp.]
MAGQDQRLGAGNRTGYGSVFRFGDEAGGVPRYAFRSHAANEAPWKAAVAEAIGTHDVPAGARSQVEVEFRLPVPVTRNDAWDLDNLLRPTLDALGGVVGWRRWNGPRQADDERIDRIVASKRTVRDGESVGARIRVSILRDDPAASMIDARS